MKKVAVVLSGCGHQDGAEIHESVFTLLALDKAGAEYQGFAPDRNQHHVVNHLTGQEMPGSRNMLIEAARIMRGNIKPLSEFNVDKFDAVIFPGGTGAAKNFFDLALKGEHYSVQKEIHDTVKAIIKAGKPAGFICIMPMVIPHTYPKGAELTLGTDKNFAAMVEKMGYKHVDCQVTDCVIDKAHKLVTTPAYMLGKNTLEVATGIEKLVNAVLAMS
jgi:enhancing lycopene biosynthesis protein 2